MNNLAKFQPQYTTKPLFNGLFDEFFGRNIGQLMGSDAAVSNALVNVLETDDAFQLEVAAPGFQKGDFGVKIENDYLYINGRHEAKAENGEERYTRREFRFESFERSFKLPKTVNQDGIAAVYEHGILLVTIPKVEEAKTLIKTINII